MKLSPSTIVLLILVAALAIATTVLLVIVTKKPVKTEDMIRNEVLLEVKEKERLKDSVVWSMRVQVLKDSLKASDDRYELLEAKKQPIIIRHDKIPVTVSTLDKRQLHEGTDTF